MSHTQSCEPHHHQFDDQQNDETNYQHGQVVQLEYDSGDKICDVKVNEEIIEELSHFKMERRDIGNVVFEIASINLRGKARSPEMPSLAVFDFDRTIVDGDSDATIINRLREKQPPPEWEGGPHDWTPYMSDVFEHAFTAGFSPEDILDTIASMPATPGMEELITTLADAGWDIILLTDANSVFVQHWLKTHGLERHITSVITNPAFFAEGRLFIKPLMRQTACPNCPMNLCKSVALAQWCQNKEYSEIMYVGDGKNDFCPVSHLPPHAKIFPRLGYPLSNLVRQIPPSLRSTEPVHWENAYTIQRDVFPGEKHD